MRQSVPGTLIRLRLVDNVPCGKAGDKHSPNECQQRRTFPHTNIHTKRPSSHRRRCVWWFEWWRRTGFGENRSAFACTTPRKRLHRKYRDDTLYAVDVCVWSRVISATRRVLLVRKIDCERRRRRRPLFTLRTPSPSSTPAPLPTERMQCAATHFYSVRMYMLNDTNAHRHTHTSISFAGPGTW